MLMTDLVPGVVYVVNTGSNWAARLIRAGEALRGLPSNGNHVAVMHHVDPAGVPWGVEGRPGGVGWVDMRGYLASPYTVSNSVQPIDPADRQKIADAAAQMLGTPYDWDAIVHDAAIDLGLPDLFAQNWHGHGSPGHVVCSSLAAWVQRELGWPAPLVDGSARYVQPGDWAKFDATEGWRP